jgi:hypothetical protein
VWAVAPRGVHKGSEEFSSFSSKKLLLIPRHQPPPNHFQSSTSSTPRQSTAVHHVHSAVDLHRRLQQHQLRHQEEPKYGKNKSGRQSPNKQCYRSRVLSSGRPASSLTVLSSFIECSSNY